MAKNKFDKEKITTISDYDVPGSFMVFGDEKIYDISEKHEFWWKCPKCGGNISFDSNVEEFDEELGENQFITVYSWDCEDCEAHGSIHAVVNPLYISIEQDEN